jgi:Dioxygenase
VRRNITEGKPGVPLTLRLGVVDASSCKPIRNAAVDVWHCDAGGTYSATSQEGTEGLTFLRGIQRTDRKGIATFRTIYPGWYPGRTVHIHLKVYLGGTTVHTGQLFFADRVTDAVYKRAPYNRRPNRDPRNAGDSIFRNGGSRSLLALTRNGSGYVGRITMGVTRSSVLPQRRAAGTRRPSESAAEACNVRAIRGETPSGRRAAESSALLKSRP